MGNYEIFAQPDALYATLFAFVCLIVAGIIAVREAKLRLPIVLLLCGFALDFAAVWVEAKAVENQSNGVEVLVMFEMILFVLMMFFMAMSASAFAAQGTKLGWVTWLPAWILGGLGVISIVLFTVILPDGEIINKLRIILPLTAFCYLAVGLAARLKSPYRLGCATAFALATAAATTAALKFANIYASTEWTWGLYVLFALSFLLMQNDEMRGSLRRADKEISNYNQKIEEIIKLSPFPIVISRLSDDRIILANNNAVKIFGMREDDVGSYNLKDFFADSSNKQLLLEKLEENREVQDFEVLIKTAQNSAPFWLLASANIIDYNNDIAIYAAFQDITSRKVRENVLQNQAIRDPLTSLYNRRYFEAEAAKRIKAAKKAGAPFSVLMLDADFFKKVNDTYGHKIGDKVLIELAGRTEKALRDCDIVARYGGEEFLVFLPNINIDQAQKVAERLRVSIASIVVKTETGKDVKFTVSIGATSSEISDEVDTLIKTADEALYKAKQNGRNRVEVFTKADWQNFVTNGSLTQQNKNVMHPAFSSENNAEISLLDGADTHKNGV
ncbi:MAG: diguanylate cyclase [Alphaproteobacteria bacterium]|nr:diguanylate cyclase [Alphaproteobacteria bacterium]